MAKKPSSLSILGRMLIIALGVLLAANVSDGISYDDSIPTLILVVILLTVLNVFLKPLLLLFTLPFIILTFGIGILFVNAAILGIVSWLVPTFHVDGIGAALLGALIISLTSFVANLLIGQRPGHGGTMVRVHRQGGARAAPRREKDDDVIDI